MKEITIKIKPKLKWKRIDKKKYSAKNNEFEIEYDWAVSDWQLYCWDKGYTLYFKSLKTAKAVAELLYQG